MSPVPLSILDLAFVGEHETIRDSFEGSVRLARRAEELGYRRVWYAEHHNIRTIASSATAVLIAHVAARTERIRLGSGGIMLPNPAPLIIAEQFGTLATLHPDRIDLGLGRAPGTDQETFRALRRDPAAADTFPQDVLELQSFLAPATPGQRVEAVPGLALVSYITLVTLGLALLMAFIRIVRGPTLPDRIVGMDLFGVLVVGLIVVLAASSGARASLDAAIVIALIGFVGTVAYATYVERGETQ